MNQIRSFPVSPEPDSAIVEAVKMRVSRERPLNVSCVKNEQPELLEAAMSARPFIGWSSYVAAAGLEYDCIEHEFVECLECPVCQKPFKHLGNHMLLKHEDSPEHYGLPAIAEGLIISKAGDLREKPTNFEHWEAAWSKEYAADYFYHYFTSPEAKSCRSNSFQTAIIRFWGGVHELCRELDLLHVQYNSFVYVTKNDVLKGIRTRHARGLSLRSSSLYRGDNIDFGLVKNAQKYFPSWAEAVAAAGVPVSVPKRPRAWTRETVAKAFRECLIAHGPDLRYSEMRKIDIGLSEAIRLYLVPYNKAKAQILRDGLDSDEAPRIPNSE